MGFFCAGGASPSSLLCEESMDAIFGCNDDEGELPELGAANLDLLVFPLESDEVIASLMAKEKEQLTDVVAAGDYLQRLNSGGPVSSWRIAAIDWINKAHAHHNFGPLCFYLSVNYLDRFLSSNEPQADKPWMQQLVSVACLFIAAKMEETEVPRFIDLQIFSEKYKFEVRSIKKVEIFVLNSLKWRMQAVTPFSYINYFLDKFTNGMPLTCGFASRCTELILGTLEATKFLEFRPSEMAAAVVLSVAAENHILDFSSALIASNIPVDKDNVRRCHEAMQEVGLVKREGGNVSPSVPESPSGVLDTSCFSSKTDDNNQTPPGSAQANNNQAYTSAQKWTRLDA